jgi:hypothetical protein
LRPLTLELPSIEYVSATQNVSNIGMLDLMDALMQKHGRVGIQWKSRVSNQRARALFRNWVREQYSPDPEAALKHAQDAHQS